MFQHIVVPLDGSKLSESALPAARYLAATLGAQVTLVHVVEEDAPPTIHGERHLRSPEEAEKYLHGISRLVSSSESTITCHVHTAASKDVVQSIVAHEDELTPDLIVMCTHGRGGFRRIFIGSIAQQVVATGHTPVLLIRPDRKNRDASFAIKMLLAPLDGERAHEQGLDIALRLALKTGARLQLLSVLPTMGTLAGRDATMGRFMPGTLRAILEFAKGDLGSYLDRQVQRLQNEGVSAAAELRVGDIAPTIVAVADCLDASMIILGTHGKSGNEAFWTKSVAASVQAHTKRPLLLIPVK